MAKVKPDYSFERGGVPLAQWLWRLVANERQVREAAGEALQAMQYGVPSAHTDFQDMDPCPDVEGQMKRFAQVVREAVVRPGFDTAEFVVRLCTYRLGTKDDWLARVDKMSQEQEPVEKKWERISKRLVEKLNHSQNPAARETAKQRLERALCACAERDARIQDRALKGAEAMSQAAMTAHMVFDALDTAFLAAPEALALVLEHKHDRYIALQALERIGPPGIAFAPQLLEQIDRLPEAKHPYADEAVARALGAIGRDDGNVVDALSARLEHPHSAVRQTAAAALSCMGTAVAGRTALIVAKLKSMVEAKATRLSAIDALASVGRHDAEARRQVIDLARARPPEWEQAPEDPGNRYDRVMAERAVALDAMRHLTEYPEECVPVLIDAIDTFEEFDPDECYSGPVGRVAGVLERFGTAAGSAAAALARKLEGSADDYPRAILDALAAIGPSAAGVIELLMRFRAKVMGGETLPDLETIEPDKLSDHVGWVIHRIRRDQSR